MMTLARIGCLARAAVYLLVGALALLVALGSSYGVTTDESGALRHMDLLFGHIVLIVLAAGLFCYALWRFFQAYYDLDTYGRSLHGLSIRTGFLFSGLFHALLAYYSLNIVFRLSQRKTVVEQKELARWILLYPLGRYVLLAAGISVVFAGYLQFFRATNGTFTRDLNLPPRHEQILKRICAFGLMARGVVFVIIGIFFLNAGWRSRSREVGGLQKAWDILGSQPHGSFLLGVIAAGFMAFAVFAYIEGFYHRKIKNS